MAKEGRRVAGPGAVSRRAGRPGNRPSPSAAQASGGKSREEEPEGAQAKRIASTVAGILVLASVVFIMGLWFARNPGPGRTPSAETIAAQKAITATTLPSPRPVPTPEPLVKPAAQATKPTPTPVPAAKGSVQSLTIATWNVRDCAIVDKKTGIRTNLHDSIARVTKNAGADILVLEEVQSDSKPGGDMTSLSFALAKEGWTMPYTAILETGTQDDIAILSRYRIVSQESVARADRKGDWPRPALLARIDVKGRELTVIGLHLKALSDADSLGKRRAQARALADYLRGRVDEKRLVVVAGDMNTTSVGDRLPVGEGAESGLGTTTMGYLQIRDDAQSTNDLFAVNEYLLPGKPTYDKGAHRNILDHILLSGAAKSAYVGGSVAVRDSDPDVDMRSVSDHFPVLLRLEIPLSGF